MMFCRPSYTLFYFIVIISCITGESLVKKNEKRVGNRNNYQMCVDSFDIHKDKIIRTQDSLNMGAKYLNVHDVDSRDECLKYCCNIDQCDVFIFEEKKPGSCYLFQCGPINDFKCKFTSYANYTSAVRTNYNPQSNPQMEEEIRISQQEHELKSLRKIGGTEPVEYSPTEASIKLIATLAPTLPLTTPIPPKQGCSHNQYQCRSSGDCIAIYNVCDGIPQCADGSDEVADSVCPTEKPTVSPSMVIQGPLQPPQPQPPPLPADIIKYQQIVDPHKSLAPLYVHGPEANPKPWDLTNLARQVLPQQQSLLYPAQQMAIPQLRKGFSAPGYQWDYQQLYERNKDPYIPVNSYHDPNNLNPYEQEQPHIFNHKGRGVIGEKEGQSSYLDQKRPHIPHFPSSNRDTWQDSQVLPSSSVIPNIQQKEIENPEKHIVSTTVPPCNKATPEKAKEIGKTNKKTEKHALHDKGNNQDTGKLSSSKSSNSKFNHVQTKEPKEGKSLILIEEHTRDHARSNLLAEHLQQVNENETLRPKGAVISLALGLTITAITATLIACRLRVVRRRGRRGHGPYAHDADYLVNGMYL